MALQYVPRDAQTPGAAALLMSPSDHSRRFGRTQDIFASPLFGQGPLTLRIRAGKRNSRPVLV